MKASEAKRFIGKLVSYRKAGWPGKRAGVVKATVGRNIIMDDDSLWAPDISDMQLIEEETPAIDSMGDSSLP